MPLTKAGKESWFEFDIQLLNLLIIGHLLIMDRQDPEAQKESETKIFEIIERRKVLEAHLNKMQGQVRTPKRLQ